MPTLKRQIGDTGESLAQKYLKNKGYQIIATNYHSKFGEIDIIAKTIQEVDWLVFIEVKTRTHEDPLIFGHAEELVDYSKEKKIVATANIYMDKKNISPDHWRIDVIVVDLNTETRRAQIRHFQNI